MSLGDENLRLALVKAIADVVSEHIGAMRTEHMHALMEQYTENGVKQFSVKLPDGTKVATITLAEQKEAYEVTDRVAFLKWMGEHHPDAIETVTVPATAEWTYSQVNERAEDRLLKGLAHMGDLPFDAATGELVEGVTYRPAGRPKSFSVRYETDGRAQVIDAWRLGELAQLVGSDVLPQIGSAP